MQDSEVSHQDTQEAQTSSDTFSQDRRLSNSSTDRRSFLRQVPEQNTSIIAL